MEPKEPDDEITEDSTTAENIRAWKELLSSKESKEFVDSVLQRATVLFGQTQSAKLTNLVTSAALMLVAFGSIGTFAYLKLIPDSTTGVLAGIVIGYFFKRRN